MPPTDKAAPQQLIIVRSLSGLEMMKWLLEDEPEYD